MKTSYVAEHTRSPQALVSVAVAEELPTSLDLWDNDDGVFTGAAGICDLVWWPGWMLDDNRYADWPSWKTGKWQTIRWWP